MQRFFKTEGSDFQVASPRSPSPPVCRTTSCLLLFSSRLLFQQNIGFAFYSSLSVRLTAVLMFSPSSLHLTIVLFSPPPYSCPHILAILILSSPSFYFPVVLTFSSSFLCLPFVLTFSQSSLCLPFVLTVSLSFLLSLPSFHLLSVLLLSSPSVHLPVVLFFPAIDLLCWSQSDKFAQHLTAYFCSLILPFISS